jgi:hypothetical protein
MLMQENDLELLEVQLIGQIINKSGNKRKWKFSDG